MFSASRQEDEYFKKEVENKKYGHGHSDFRHAPSALDAYVQDQHCGRIGNGQPEHSRCNQGKDRNNDKDSVRNGNRFPAVKQSDQ